jgi:hypothetical protein
MDWPYKFPSHADVIAEDAAETLRLPLEARLDRLLAMIAEGRALASDPATCRTHRQVKERVEADWQRAHREVFERYGK